MKSGPRAKSTIGFRGRMMFPICNDIGEVIAFSGRILKERCGDRKISQLARDAAFPQRQHSFRTAQDQTQPDRREHAPSFVRDSSI